MSLRTTGSPRSTTLHPYTALFRSPGAREHREQAPAGRVALHRAAPVRSEALYRHGRQGLRHFATLSVVPAQVARYAVQLEQERSEEHTSELQSLMRNSYAVFCLKKKITNMNN